MIYFKLVSGGLFGKNKVILPYVYALIDYVLVTGIGECLGCTNRKFYTEK